MEPRKQIQVIVPPAQHVQPQQTQTIQSQRVRHESNKVRTLSVDQALQFTPLTTSVLPAHDRIPIPQIGRAKESARLVTSAERKNLQPILASYPTSKLKERLHDLLRPDLVPQYKFKQCLSSDDRLQSGTQPSAESTGQPTYHLSSMAKMLLDTTAVEYKYPSRLQVPKKMTTTMKPSTPQYSAKSYESKVPQSAPASNDRTLSGPDGQMSSISKPLNRPILINLPKPPLEPQVKISTGPVLTTDNKLNRDEPLVRIPSHRIQSQREVSDVNLQQFQNLLLEVFEAQDQLDAGSTAVYDTGFFEVSGDGDDAEPSLSLKIMEKLVAGLKKLETLKRINDLSSEHLRRLQRLCEPAIDKTQTINLKLQADAESEEQQVWKQNIRKADIGLTSASVLMHTLSGSSSSDDSLLATEALTWIPSALRNAFENCLVACIEARPDEVSREYFKTASLHKDDLKRLLETGRRVLDLVSTACTRMRGLENVVNPVEFLAAKLIFVQNAATDKSSILGIQTFERVRKTAMSGLARIFAKFPAERGAILDEVLTSLDKLPSNSRIARQYRLGDGKSIQLISALFMQLVQNTAIETPVSKSKTKGVMVNKPPGELHDEENEDETMLSADGQDESDNEGALSKLRRKGDKLFDVAARSAQEIVLYLVARASRTTKTGDSPYRNVFDLFIEDMVAVLSLPEWPSSELMLRIMAAKTIDMAQNEKTAAAKNMALECLGTMGSAISTLKASLPKRFAAIAREGRAKTDATTQLSKFAGEEQGTIHDERLVAFDGPLAIVSRHLWTEADQGLRNLSACGYFLAQYAKIMSLVTDEKALDEGDIEAEPVRVANFLLESMSQISSGSALPHNFEAVSRDEAELAYTLSVLNMGFCRRYSVIIRTLSSSFSSDQAQVRSRSLKSVITMLETDPTLLDRDPTIADDVFRCASDDSAMVRDSALSLIARFIIPRQAFEQKGIERLLECASDTKVGVQKRAIGHLKDIYIKDHRAHLKSHISRVILRRTADHEVSVAELAQKTLTEIWITPAMAHLTHAADLAKTKVAIEELTGDIVSCVSIDSTTLCPLLKKFIKSILASEPKTMADASVLLEKIVEVLFEKSISDQDDRGPLVVLTSFAEADPQLIPPTNLGKLQSYLGNLKTENDLFVFKAVISIFGCVLPHLSATHKPLLSETQNALMKAISSLGRRAELDTVMSCLQIIDGVLQNTMRLIKLAGSIMIKIKNGTAVLAKSQDTVPQLLKLLRIAGAMARYIDLEKYWQQFALEVKDMKGRSVAGYTANIFLPLTHANQPSKVRLLALESLGSLCQAFPSQLNQKAVQESFFSVFRAQEMASSIEDQDALQNVVLKIFDELYAQRAMSKEADENADAEHEKQELGKLGGDSRTRDGDSAISMVTGSVAKHALMVALSAPSDNALIATRTLASISHQGLNHPKQSLLAFVALSTCPDTRIAAVSHDAHRLLHQQHESVCEREYITAIHEAFEYQRNIIQDPRGARQPSYRAKLQPCFEVINNSSPKYVKKFLSGVVSRISARLSSDDGETSMEQVFWTLFSVQNLAFFEFNKADEVLHTILQLELAYSKKGVEISQLLEAALSQQLAAEIPQDIEMDGLLQPTSVPTQTHPDPDMNTIKRLAPTAATLTIMMECRSYLKRQYGVGRDVRTAITSNKQAKDTMKAPTRVHGITGERFWSRSNAIISLLQDGDEGILACCREFVTLMSMDDEVNVDDSEQFFEPSTSAGPADTNGYARAGTPAGVKRKLSASASSTPAKRAAGRPRKEARRSASFSSADDPDADVAT